MQESNFSVELHNTIYLNAMKFKVKCLQMYVGGLWKQRPAIQKTCSSFRADGHEHIRAHSRPSQLLSQRSHQKFHVPAHERFAKFFALLYKHNSAVNEIDHFEEQIGNTDSTLSTQIPNIRGKSQCLFSANRGIK